MNCRLSDHKGQQFGLGIDGVRLAVAVCLGVLMRGEFVVVNELADSVFSVSAIQL